MSESIRFAMIGGFLGAGKTTTLARLASHYMKQGLSVGIVTNDQAADLVDTNTLRSLGFDVGEVAGACFCCRFDDLISTMQRLGTENRPNVILAEPVGSCTDLVATVVQPIKHLYGASFEVSPYVVILKPNHGRRILRGEKGSGFSPKAAYILEKQLEEADVIAINRVDELSPEEVQELVELIEARCPSTPIIRVSAKTGQGFESLTEVLSMQGDFGRRILEIDYDTYAEGEAELGWLNSSMIVQSQKPFSLDDFLMSVIKELAGNLNHIEAETAHLKLIGLWEGFFSVANLVSSDSKPVLSLPSNSQTREADVIVNARVALDPEILHRMVQDAVNVACRHHGTQVQLRNTQSFRPGRPMPTHRYASADN